MKPRLPPQPLTLEDRVAWQQVGLGRLDLDYLQHRDWMRGAMAADRRDADLMWYLVSDFTDWHSWQREYPGVIHAAWAFRGLSTSELVL